MNESRSPYPSRSLPREICPCRRTCLERIAFPSADVLPGAEIVRLRRLAGALADGAIVIVDASKPRRATGGRRIRTVHAYGLYIETSSRIWA
jgi:hypothetical protein